MRIAEISPARLADEAPPGQVRPQRAAWSKPTLRRLAMSEAERGLNLFFDAGEGFS